MNKVAIKDIAAVINGATPSTKHPEYYDGEITWITPKDLAEQNTKYIYHGEKNITAEGYNSCSTTMISANNILMSSRAPIGLVSINKVDCCTNQGFKSLVVDRSKCDVEYLYYYLKAHIKEIEVLGSGTTFKEVSKASMENYEIELPDIEIQKEIASLLTDIDDKILNNKNAINTLESMAKTIYDYWFLQFEFPNEDGKPYKSSGGKMVWNEELKREIPEGWGVTNVGNITTCLDSKRVPLSSKDRESMKGPYPYYGATSEMDSVNEYLFDGDYVLLAEDGSVMDDNGFPILQRTSGKVWVNNHAHVLQPKKPYGCKLLMFILKNIPVSMIKTGSIQMKVNQENLNAFKVLSIPENLIEKANSILNPIDAKIIMLKQENRELASLRDFLLPMLMNGQVTFKEDE